MADLFADTGIWVLISFLLFMVVILRLGKGKVLGALDSRIEQIRTEIKTAESLRSEAEALLTEYQAKQRNAEQEAEKIIANAKQAAVEIGKRAETDLNDLLARKEVQLNERLKRMEDAAKAEIKAYAADLAIKATAEIIAGQLDADTNNRLIDSTIKSIPGQLN